MNENVDHNPPISADELKIEFDKLKNVFYGDSPSEKIDATADMLVLVSRYLGNNIPSFDATPISIVLGEIAHIRNGGEPDFIKSEKTEGGRTKDVLNQMKTTSIVVVIDIMSDIINGLSQDEGDACLWCRHLKSQTASKPINANKHFANKL